MSTIIYALLLISCSGHTNAKCTPSITVYDTREQCEAARVRPPSEVGLFGFGAHPGGEDERSVCFPIPQPQEEKVK